MLVQARLLDDLRSKEKERSEYRERMLAAIKRLHAYENRIEASEAPPRRKRRQGRLKGLPAAPGFGRGRAHLLLPAVRFEVIDDRRTDDVAGECQRFQHAVAESVQEMETLKARLTHASPSSTARSSTRTP